MSNEQTPPPSDHGPVGPGDGPPGTPGDELPEPMPAPPRKKFVFSWVWVVPIIAIAVAVALVVTAKLEQGLKVKVSFDRADGLDAGTTVVKYRSVTVGRVEAINLNDELDGIDVTLGIDRVLEPYLRSESRFWVVRPRVGAGGISGLETLISGAYIEFDPGEGQPATTFEGLDRPPAIPGDVAGRRIKLRASSLGSVSEGSPVLYRDIQVGQTEGYQLFDGYVEIDVYIQEEYESLVRKASRFWQVSGVELVMNSSGIRFSTASVETLLRGGIAFATPPGGRGSPAAKDGATFQLYGSETDVGDEYIDETYPFILYFESSVRGLEVGAPVEFRGIKIGEVTAVSLEYDVAREWLQIPVRIELQPGRLRLLGRQEEPFVETIKTFVTRGLRARAEVGSLLTSSLYIALDFDGDAPLERRAKPGDPPEIPTVPSNTDQFIDGASEFMAKLEELPLDRVAASTVAALDSVTRMSQQVEKDVIPVLQSLGEVSESANDTLVSLQSAIPETSAVRDQVLRTLQELAAAAASFRNLADLLSREPESLLRGRR